MSACFQIQYTILQLCLYRHSLGKQHLHQVSSKYDQDRPISRKSGTGRQIKFGGATVPDCEDSFSMIIYSHLDPPKIS